MFIYFQKILSWFFSPIGIIFGFFALLFLKFRKTNLFFFFLVFILFSNYPLANFLLAKLENYNNKELNLNYNDIYAVVILGGGKTRLISHENKEINLADTSGRYLQGINTFKKVNAEKIVISRLKLPWTNEFDDQINDLIKYITSLKNIDESNILVLDEPFNTNNESEILYNIVGKKKIILVTSAYHAQRSKIIFENAGFDVVLEKVEYFSSELKNHLLLYFPNEYALRLNTILIKEILGIFYYSIFK